ncbi:hypothetical protein HYV30_02165 [Candidatus Kaiserbacteria bacterium]|nr:hypothetical protein [Candidatus Kaiserbacteria bacterium]
MGYAEEQLEALRQRLEERLAAARAQNDAEFRALVEERVRQLLEGLNRVSQNTIANYNTGMELIRRMRETGHSPVHAINEYERALRREFDEVIEFHKAAADSFIRFCDRLKRS